MSSVAPAPVPLAVPHSIYLGRGGQQCSPPANRPHPPWPPPDPALAQLSLGLSLLVSTRRCMCCVRVGHPSRDARRRLYAVSHRGTRKRLHAVSPVSGSGQPHKTVKGTLRSLQSRPCSRPTSAQLPHHSPCRAGCSSAHANILALACAGVFLGADAKHGCCVCDSHSREGSAQFNA